MIIKNNLAVIAAVFSMTVLPSLAQNEISNNQPVSKTLSAEEVRIEAKLKLNFKNGLIDSNQLAAMQRDFDGILVKEDSYKSGGGMTSDGHKAIEEALCQFEAKLDKASGGVETTAGAEAVKGPKADMNNAALDQIAPTK